MINGRFLGTGGAANRDNNYILDQIARLRDIPVHVVHGRYDRVCHVYQAETEHCGPEKYLNPAHHTSRGKTNTGCSDVNTPIGSKKAEAALPQG
jgi:hypothetical protein